MKNDYKIGDTKISIPPTVLFTAVAVMDDATKSVSMDAKDPGDVVYVLGETKDEMGGSEFLALSGQLGRNVPKVDPVKARAMYEKLSHAIAEGYVASCHDCSDGGLAVALAETACAGGYGMDLDLRVLGLESDWVAMFSESQSRIVVTVAPEHVQAFEQALNDTPLWRLGTVTEDPTFRVRGERELQVPIEELKDAWQRPLAW